MRYRDAVIFFVLAFPIVPVALHAQRQSVSPTDNGITADRLITFNGIVKDASGQPKSGSFGMTFRLYAAQEGGEPLWTEMQTVQTGEQGKYTVLLGSAAKDGLPLEVFSSGKAQWLGVQLEGADEEARVLLVAVPYALKAADADTVGGKPISSFVLHEDLTKAMENNNFFALFPAQRGNSGRISTEAKSGSAGSVAGGARLQASNRTGGAVPLYTEDGTNTLAGIGTGANFVGGVLRPTNNSFFGYNAGVTDNLGNHNTFLGSLAGASNTLGSQNTMVGYYAGYTNLSGNYNTYSGNRVGAYATGSNNSFFGYEAGRGLSNASNNTASGNSFFGYQAGLINSAGAYNSFFGNSAGRSNTTGSGNSFFGEGSGYNSTASNSTFVGYEAGYSNTSGESNSYFGTQAGRTNTVGARNSAFGQFAGYWNTASDNSFLGYNAGYGNSIGVRNSAFGSSAGFANNAGDNNSVFGFSAGYSNVNGDSNSFFGASAGYSNVNGSNNSIFGESAGYANTGTGNSFFGQRAGASNVGGNHNSFLGNAAGARNTSGHKNLFLGVGTGDSNTTESFNSFIGANSTGAAGITNATAIGFLAKVAQSNSLVLGSIAGENSATESTKVGIGTTSPEAPLHVRGTLKVVQSSSLNDTAGVYQQFNTSAYSGFGYFGVEGSTPGVTVSGTSAYATLLASGSSGGSLQLGSAGVIRMTIRPNGNVGIGTAAPAARLHVVGGVLATDGFSSTSDARMKQDIEPLAYGLDDVLQLRPVSFHWKDRQDGKLNLGLLAQEVAGVIPEVVEKSKDDAGTLALNYPALIPVLIKAAQEQQSVIEGLKTENAALNARLSALEQMMEHLTGRDQSKEK